MKYLFKIRCTCGAGYSVGAEYDISAQREVMRWEEEHRRNCAKAAANEMKDKVAEQECACDVMNPSGDCCLGSIGRWQRGVVR